ncbi:ATP-binding protein [Sporosarcina sp. CAU 1771]
MIDYFLDELTDPVAYLSYDGELIQVNDAFHNAFRLKNLNNIQELFSDAAKETWKEFLEIVGKMQKVIFYLPIQTSVDTFLFFEIKLVYSISSKGVIAHFKKPQITAKRLETTYANAFYKSNHMMFFMDQNKIIYDFNEICTNELQIDREKHVGTRLKDVLCLHPEIYNQYETHLKEAVTNGKSEFYTTVNLEKRGLRHFQIKIIYIEDTCMYLIQLEDRTEQTKIEEGLARKDTMSTIGQLAASIAHEIRNPMTSLKGFTQLLKVSATEESKRYLTVIDDEIIRMESILSEMLILSKPSTSVKEIIHLKALISSIVQVILPKANIDKVEIIEKNCVLLNCAIYGDEGKLKQVFLNLFKNALEAMPSGGTLTITIEQSLENGVTVSIVDTGTGLKEKQLQNIFTPYFTTKDEGTGLGLPFVLKTVEEHEGTISVESEVGIGTKFLVKFPQPAMNAKGEFIEEGVASSVQKKCDALYKGAAFLMNI